MAKTRIQLTVEPELGDLLKALATETNSSLSGLIAELLMEQAPVLEKNLELFKMAAKLKKSGRERSLPTWKQRSRSWNKRWNKA